MLDKNGNKTTARRELFLRLRALPWLPDYAVEQHVVDILDGRYSEAEFVEQGKEFYTCDYDPMSDF